MTEKRKRERAGKLQGNSFPELRRGLTIAAANLESELKIEGEKWEPGHLLEAVVADFLTLAYEEQARRARRGQRVVESIRLRDAAGPPLSESDAPKTNSVATLPGSTFPSKRAKDRKDKPAVMPGRPLREK